MLSKILNNPLVKGMIADKVEPVFDIICEKLNEEIDAVQLQDGETQKSLFLTRYGNTKILMVGVQCMDADSKITRVVNVKNQDALKEMLMSYVKQM